MKPSLTNFGLGTCTYILTKYVVKTYVYIPGRRHNSHLHHYRVHSLFLDIGPYSPDLVHILLFFFHSCSSLVKCQLYCIRMLNFIQDYMHFRRIICSSYVSYKPYIGQMSVAYISFDLTHFTPIENAKIRLGKIHPKFALKLW